MDYRIKEPKPEHYNFFFRLTRSTNHGYHGETSTCRYGMKCLRNHCRPAISRLLLIPNFFTHIRLDQNKHTEYGNDFSLEIDDSELYRDFTQFFNDIEPELQSFGKIINLCVCSNQEPHLRGHTYVEYDHPRHALKAYRHLHGRYYGGRMLNVEFSQLITWHSAVCGLSFANKCPKGRSCNFLHLFKNPQGKYPLFEASSTSKTQYHRNNGSRHRLTTTAKSSADQRIFSSWDDGENRKQNWRWSESPETELPKRKHSSFSRSLSTKRQSSERGERRSTERHSRSRTVRNKEKLNK